MRVNLKQWQSYLLFIPLVISIIITSIPHHGLYNYQTYFAAANLLLVLSLCLVLSYQAILALNFIKQDDNESIIFKINIMIPVVFFWMYLCYVSYLTFMSNNIHNPKYVPGPVRMAQMSLNDWIVLILLIYGLINYLFINNQYILGRIKKQKEIDRQEYLKSNYWLPMRKFVRVSVWVFAGLMILSIIIDIATLTTK